MQGPEEVFPEKVREEVPLEKEGEEEAEEGVEAAHVEEEAVLDEDDCDVWDSDTDDGYQSYDEQDYDTNCKKLDEFRQEINL